MTMTESPPASATDAAAPSPATDGLYDALSTTDHKRTGRFWLAMGLLLLGFSVVIGILVGAESLDATSTDVFGGDNAYLQMWALYRFALAILVAAPLFIGLAMVVVPMQVGSTNIAFPRAAAASAWGFLVGTGIMLAAVFAGGGWGAIDAATGDERDAVALTLVGFGMVVASILLASVCIATTVVSLRTEGMTLARVPLFAWSMLVAAAVWLITLPVLLANVVIAYVDLHNGPGTFGGGLDGDVSIFEQLTWVVEQPQVYAFAIPALGVLGSIAGVTAGVRHSRHTEALTLIGVFGVLSVGAWSQPYFQQTLGGVDYDEKFVFVAFAIGAVVVTLATLGTATDTLLKGRTNIVGFPATHLSGALGAAKLVFFATVAGLLRVIEPLDLGGTTAISGIMNLVLFGAVVAALAGIWFWAPKVAGVKLASGLGHLSMITLVIGAFVLGGAQVVNGFFDTSNNPLEVPTEDAAEVLDAIAFVGMIVIALGVLFVAMALVRAARADDPAETDPWGGHTLEWATASPPPTGNFAEPPALVHSEAPLLDAADRETDETGGAGDETGGAGDETGGAGDENEAS